MENEIFLDDTKYLKDIPTSSIEYGLPKVLTVRAEVIHIKHIFTEIFIRKTIDIEKILELNGWTLFRYMEYMTSRLRKIHKLKRAVNIDPNKVKNNNWDYFFNSIKLFNKTFNNVIVLDFDGVVTSKNFLPLYDYCLDVEKTVICSANPTIKDEYFNKRNIYLPNKIYSMKGRKSKLNQLLEIHRKQDMTFFVDNEEKYLEFAWVFGIKTYHYKDNKINKFTLKTK